MSYTTSVASVTSFFPKPQNGLATTLASTIAHAASTVPLTSTGAYANGDIVVLVIEPTSSTAKEVFTGTIDTSGIQVTGCVWTGVQGTNPTHSGGVAVVDYFTATHIDMVSKGILVAHNQDGTHKSGATYLLPTIASFANANHDHTNSAGGGAIGTNAVAAAALATNAITLGYAQITTGFATASLSAVQVTGLTITVTIPAGGRRVKITVWSYAVFNNTNGDGTDIYIWDGTVGSGTQLATSNIYQPAGNQMQVPVTVIAVVTPAAGSKTYNVGFNAVTGGTSTLGALSGAPAFILVEAI